jgi:hypothetical protein
MEVTMRTCVLLLTFFFLLLFSSATHAVTVYVPDDFVTIQAGIDACTDGDTVIVRDGTYTGDGNRDIIFWGKAIVLMSENGPETTIIDCEGSPSDIHRGFWFQYGEDSGAVVNGFTIQNGFMWNGGGIYCQNNSSPTITGNIIRMNISGSTSAGGGGIHSDFSSPRIEYNRITGNITTNFGGGIYCNYSGSQGEPTIIGNVIAGNMAELGGGICCYTSSPTIMENTISENTANYGGGILCDNSSPTIVGNYIAGNTAFYVPGWGIGGGIYCYQTSTTIVGNTITGNTAENGGGAIGCWEGSPIIEGNKISGNMTDFGGGISISYCSSTISNNLITNNAADSSGGGLCFLYSSDTLNNNTIAENYAAFSGGGIFLIDSCTVSITNTISWNNDAVEGAEIWIGYYFSTIPSTLTISYSDVEGGEEGAFVDTGCTLNWGLGMIDDNPRFVRFHGFDHLLGRGSPCIDAGDPTIDDGFEWPEWYNNGSHSDMGAYGGPGNVIWLP